MSAPDVISIPMRTVSALNAREHWRKRMTRVRAERAAVFHAIWAECPSKPSLPCVVTLTRVAPSNGLDPDDNLPGSLKGVRDELASWLGVDDKRRDVVRYVYAQRRGPWAVEIQFSPMTVEQTA